MYASVAISAAMKQLSGASGTVRSVGRERELAELRLRLLNQLDQRVGREKAVLRRTIAALNARLRRQRRGGGGQARAAAATGQSR